MEKKRLLERCEKWKKSSEKIPLLGYPRSNQKEMIEMSTAIIKAICEQRVTTPFIAKEALKMAAEIIEKEMQHGTIS